MYKLSGAALIIAMTTYYGFYLTHQLKERVNVIDAFIYSFDYIQSQIKYGLTPFPLICKELSHNINNNIVSAMYKNIYINLTDIVSSKENTFDEIWIGESDKLLKAGIMKKEEIDILKELRYLNTYIDKELQIKCIGNVENKLTNVYKWLQSEVKAKTRIYQISGIMAGVVIAIILV